jgi:hypothetical protein
MAKAKGGRQARHDNATFEILVVLAIVAIVALTGQVLIHYNEASRDSSITGNVVSNGMTGFVVSDDEPNSAELVDVAISRIEVNPESPLIGDPFEVKVFFANKGTVDVTTPFVVELHFEPKTEDETRLLEPIVISTMMSEVLRAGDETSAAVLVTTIVPEGPMRIVAVSDATGKLTDANPANNVYSKTIIVATE